MSQPINIPFKENNFFFKDKKGISPVIATVLLIAMVVVIGLIVFLWFRGLNQDAITKLGQNIELTCGEVSFSADYDSSSEKLNIINDGNVNIFNMNIQIFKPGSHETKDLTADFIGWPEGGLSQGGVISIGTDFGSDVEKIIIIPILAGRSEKGDRSFECKEKDGSEISLI